MVTSTHCDIKGCNEEVWKDGKQIDVCTGFILSDFTSRKYKPFENPNINKKDLCEKHLRVWCKATYEAFYGKAEE